jgi:hypothetical protein
MREAGNLARGDETFKPADGLQAFASPTVILAALQGSAADGLDVGHDYACFSIC